ncbi:MAG: glycoside hydrolase family 2 protein [Planctomycetota bacterium]
MPKTSLDLTGKWQFKEYPSSARRMRDLDSAGWQTTTVPCSIFNSLIEAGQIKQSDIDTDPEKFTWVSEKTWIFKNTFDRPEELLGCDRTDLVFEGLDTIATIWLNNKLIGKTNNMFIPFRFDVTKLSKPQNNILLVKFEPATQYAKKLMRRYNTFSKTDFINPHRIYIRKAQYQFGWDFCPSLPGCGIIRAVRLEATKKARLDCIHIRTVDCNHKYADIQIAVKLDTVTKEEFVCKLTLPTGDETIEHSLIFPPGEDAQSTLISIEKPSLWWPAGYGQQHLYQLNIQLLNDGEIIDQMQKKFGIRTVKLNRSSDEYGLPTEQRDGENFQFEVSGQTVFAKGANWVPPSIFAGSVTDDDYEKLLNTASKANINMLRVWGGGYYGSQKFYELCDRFGIMVWQDFMFCCAYYPDRQWFLKEVKNECTEIIKRLRNHPSLVLWCGNNEIDWMHNMGMLGKGKKFYGRAIYHRLLPKLISQLDPDRPYIPTTPLDEKGKSKIKKKLTTHQWNIWTGHQPIHKYLCRPQDVPPFVTEFGLQSLPCLETIKNFCPPEGMHIGSFQIEKHNYQSDGNSRLFRYIGDLFGAADSFEQFVYLSQITQARAAKLYVEHLRAHKLKNNGVLFWQFNDCCPAISWSAVDNNQQPKALYYYAKRFFSNMLITVVPELDTPQASLHSELKPTCVIAINDSHLPLTATLNCRLIDLFGSILDHVSFPIALGPFSTSAMLKLPKAITFPRHPSKSALHLLMKRDGRKIAENLFFYLPDKYIDWPKQQIKKKATKINKNRWELELKADAITRDVQIITTVPAQLSDNFIDLIPPHSADIVIHCHQKVPSLEPLLKFRSFKSAC